MPIIPIAKFGVSLVASAGVNRIVSQIIRNNVTIVTTADKVLVTAGSIAVSSMVWETTSDHVERWFESLPKRKKKTDEIPATEEA